MIFAPPRLWRILFYLRVLTYCFTISSSWRIMSETIPLKAQRQFTLLIRNSVLSLGLPAIWNFLSHSSISLIRAFRDCITSALFRLNILLLPFYFLHMFHSSLRMFKSVSKLIPMPVYMDIHYHPRHLTAYILVVRSCMKLWYGSARLICLFLLYYRLCLHYRIIMPCMIFIRLKYCYLFS